MTNRKRYQRREIVFHEGDPGHTMHLVEKGHLAVRVGTPLGDVATVAILCPGDVFGHLAIVAPASRSATVVALDTVETLVLHREGVDELRRRHPSVDQFLLETAVAEIRRLDERLLEALYVPVDKRVARRLLELADRYQPGGQPVSVPLTQDDIAGLAGTTRPTLNRILRAMEEQGVVTLGRGFVRIEDRRGLRACAE